MTLMTVNPDLLTQMAALLAALQRQVAALHEAVRAQTELLVLLHPSVPDDSRGAILWHGNGEVGPDDPEPIEPPKDEDDDNGEDDEPELPLEAPPAEA
jgi:hypothetical protein